MLSYDDSDCLRLTLIELAHEMQKEKMRPSRILKPRVYLDGDRWCALYGFNLMAGVAGFGDTPESACVAFDDAWTGKPDPEQEPTR